MKRSPEYPYLAKDDQAFLDNLIETGQIITNHLANFFSLDSMGPCRNPLTNALFQGAANTLRRCADDLSHKLGMTIVTATNGPVIEAIDILTPVIEGGKRVKAFGVAEGGGVLVYPSRKTSELLVETLADPTEIKALSWITEEVSSNPVMATMLEDIKSDYITNTVITLPKFDVLMELFRIKHVDLERAIPDINPQNYVQRLLRYAATYFDDARIKLGLEETTNPSLIKEPNRRVYVTPRHLRGREEQLSKAGGVRFGSRILRSMPGYEGFREYRIEDSVYVADMAVVETSEGQKAIGPAERSMIVGLAQFQGQIPKGVNVLRQERLLREINSPLDYTVAEVAPRLVINVTMDQSPTTLTLTEGVLVLNTNSGNKAMDSYRYICNKLALDLAA